MLKYKKIKDNIAKRFDLNEFFEKTTFKGILGTWFLIIIIFAIAYFLLSSFTESFLLAYDGVHIIQFDFMGFLNSLYFSAVTATSLGFGDIAPRGVNKLLAAFESVFGLIIYGLLISKIVSVKQQAILEEVYELSFEDNVSRLRSSLHVSRNDFTQVLDKLENKSLSRKQLSDIWVVITLFDTNLYNITKLIAPRRRIDDAGFSRKLDNFRLELVLSSIAGCVARLLEMYAELSNHKMSITNEFVDEANASIIRSLSRISARYGLLKNDRIVTRVGEIDKLREELEKISKKK